MQGEWIAGIEKDGVRVKSGQEKGSRGCIILHSREGRGPEEDRDKEEAFITLVSAPIGTVTNYNL